MPIATSWRRAFTVVELVVVMALLGIVAAAITTTLVRQRRSGSATTEQAELRDQLNEGAGILVSDLRGISAAGGDLLSGTVGKHSVEMRTTFGLSVACEIRSGITVVFPASGSSDSHGRLTWLYKNAGAGHGVFIFDEGPSAGLGDDVWLFRTIASTSGEANACSGTPWFRAASGGKAGFTVTVDAAIPSTVAAGAPVHFVERARYALYKSSDARWYLGYCASSNVAATCPTLQPASGPYLPPDANQSSGNSGLDLIYLDADGFPTTNPFSVARIDIALRGLTSTGVTASGALAGAPARDTVRVSVELRNR